MNSVRKLCYCFYFYLLNTSFLCPRNEFEFAVKQNNRNESVFQKLEVQNTVFLSSILNNMICHLLIYLALQSCYLRNLLFVSVSWIIRWLTFKKWLITYFIFIFLKNSKYSGQVHIFSECIYSVVDSYFQRNQCIIISNYQELDQI